MNRKRPVRPVHPGCHSSFTRCAFFLLGLVALAFPTGCGKVADPVPPLVQIPAPISDLAAKQLGKEVILSCSIPRLNADGSEAKKLDSLEILRVIQPPGLPAPSEEQFRQDSSLLTIIAKESFETYRKGEKLFFTDNLEGQSVDVFQKEVCYATRVFNHKKQDAGLSNISLLQLIPVPDPPANLTPAFGEGFIELKWEPSERRIDHSPVNGEVRFNVYRSEPVSQARFQLLNKKPITEAYYRDSTAVFDTEYIYMVRSVVPLGDGFVESSDSAAPQVVNRDVYPPQPPTELSCFSNGEFVSLVWVPNSEPDLAGYDIYRSTDKVSYQKITTQLVTDSSFVDHAVEKGKLYYYRIKAVDTHKNQSQYSNEVSVRVE